MLVKAFRLNSSDSLKMLLRANRSYSTTKASKLKSKPTRASNNEVNPHISLINSFRTYREDLYSSRRMLVSPGQNQSYAFTRLNQLLEAENVKAEVQKRARFVKPSRVEMFREFEQRKRIFDRNVRNTVNRILEIVARNKRPTSVNSKSYTEDL